MVKFETLQSKEYKYGKNNFIEISRKRVLDEQNVEDDAPEFIQISKGYYDKDGNKRYKSGVGMPENPELKAFMIETLREI
jgi:hypothetical protein